MTISSIIGEATKLIVSFTLLFPVFFFFWMIIDIIMTSGNAEKRKQANQRITWGVIAMFILISIGGILAVLDQTFFSSNSSLTNPSGGDMGSPPDALPGSPGAPGGGVQQNFPKAPSPDQIPRKNPNYQLPNANTI